MESVAAPHTATGTTARDGCMFIHRMAVINFDGEVQTCSVPYAKVAGGLGRAANFDEIWNGDVMRGVRGALNTEGEWQQCRSCWYREGKFHSQRALAGKGERYGADQAGEFSGDSLNFVSTA